MKSRLFLAALLAATALLSGCGGGGSAPSAGLQSIAATAHVTFYVTWPKAPLATAAPRLLPAAALSYLIEILNSNNVVIGHAIISKPATSATVPNLPTGSLLARVSAYSQKLDPTVYPIPAGPLPLATAAMPISLQAGDNTAPPITLASTVDHIAISPPQGTPLNNGAIPVNISASVALTATPQSAPPANATIPVPSSQLHWQSSNGNIASVDQSGKVTGVAPGSAVITVSYYDGQDANGKPVLQKSGQIAVTVLGSVNTSNGQIGFTLSDPPPGTLSVTINATSAGSTVSQSFAWPPPSLSLQTLSLQSLTPNTSYAVSATAYSATNGGGSPLSVSASKMVTALTGTAASASLDLNGAGKSIIVNGLPNTVIQGQTFQLTAMVVGTANVPVPIAVTWLSSDATNAPVNLTGSVTVAANAPTDPPTSTMYTITATPQTGTPARVTFPVLSSTSGATGTVQ